MTVGDLYRYSSQLNFIVHLAHTYIPSSVYSCIDRVIKGSYLGTSPGPFIWYTTLYIHKSHKIKYKYNIKPKYDNTISLNMRLLVHGLTHDTQNGSTQLICRECLQQRANYKWTTEKKICLVTHGPMVHFHHFVPPIFCSVPISPTSIIFFVWFQGFFTFLFASLPFFTEITELVLILSSNEFPVFNFCRCLEGSLL